MAPTTKTVHFFEIRVLEAGAVKRVAPVPWSERLAAHLKIDPKERLIKRAGRPDHIVSGFDNELQGALGRVLVGDTGIQQGSWLSGHVSPVEPKSADEFFMRVSYFEFVPGCNAIATIGGAGDLPSKVAIEDAINAICPLQTGSIWTLCTLTQPGQSERLKEKKGLRSIEVVSKVEPLGLTDVGAQRTLAQALGELAADAGAPLKVSIRIRVARPRDNPQGTRGLLDMVTRDIDRLLPRSSKVIVDAEDPMATEVLNLIEHKYTAQIAMPVEEVTGESLQATILENLAIVCASRQDVISKLCNPAE